MHTMDEANESTPHTPTPQSAHPPKQQHQHSLAPRPASSLTPSDPSLGSKKPLSLPYSHSHSQPQIHPPTSKSQSQQQQHHPLLSSSSPVSSSSSSPSLPTPPPSFVSSSTSTTIPTTYAQHPGSSSAATRRHDPDLHAANLDSNRNAVNDEDMDVDELAGDSRKQQKQGSNNDNTIVGGGDGGDHDHDHGRDRHDDMESDQSSLSSSSSMDEGEEDENKTLKGCARQGSSPTLSAQRRTVGMEFHSDSDSQFDSAMDSHVNSESESDHEPESRPDTHRSRPVPTHRQDAIDAPTTATSSNASRRMSAHLTRRQSHNATDHPRSMDMNQSRGHGQGLVDRTHGGRGDQAMDHLHDLSTLAEVAQQMPRQKIRAEGGSVLHDDSTATASESEGSLALEGIDSAREWPSMSDPPRPPKDYRQSTGHNRLSEIKPSSAHHHHHHRQHHPQHQHHHQKQSASYTGPTGPTGSNLAMTRPARVREDITKDSMPRKWICKQVPVKTLGGEMMMPIWFSEEDMVLNEPIAPVEQDTDRLDQDQPGAYSHLGHHHHHYYQHHPDFLTDNPVQAHSARQKRKMKLKDMALRESRDPQDLIDLPEPMDNKRRHIDSFSKESKGKGLSKDALRTEKRLKIFREEDSGSREKVRRAQKTHRERSESQVSTRDSTPTTPNDPGIEYGSPPRQRRQHESNISSPSTGQRPRPFVCEIEDCGKRFVDALQLERHIERHGPKELECDLDMCGKLFSSIMLLRRHQSMVHKRRSEKWESPPGTTRQRSGRSRRREPRIVASGDVMDPDELERQPRGYVAEEDQLADDHDEDEGQGDVSPVHNEVKKAKESRTPKATKTPKDSKIKEHKSPVAYIPKRLAPKYEDQESAGGTIMETDLLDDGQQTDRSEAKATAPRRAAGSEEAVEVSSVGPAGPAGPRPRPFRCTYDDCKKVFIDATQLERHLERHGPKELECGIDGCRKRFSAQMLLRRHQSMVHKRRSPAVPVVSRKVASAPMAPTPAAPAPSSRLAYPPTGAAALEDSSAGSTPPDPSQDNVPNHAE